MVGSSSYADRVMDEVVSYRPVTAEARVRSQASPCGFLIDKVEQENVFLRVYYFSAVNIIPSCSLLIWSFINNIYYLSNYSVVK